MTQTDVEFLKQALLGSCDKLLKEIIENNNKIVEMTQKKEKKGEK